MKSQISVNLGTVPRIGLGCMGMSEFYGERNDGESMRALTTAFDLGYRHFDTADFYGDGHNERLLGRFIRAIGSARDDVIVATKAGIRRDGTNVNSIRIDSTPEYIRMACEQSLRRLNVERIDLYYLHRRDSNVPIEETMGAMHDLVVTGKVGAVGLSEVSAQTLRRAAAVTPVTALQSEYSLWTRDAEREALATCAEIGVYYVAYSPIGRGFLSGELTLDGIHKTGDLRNMLPRFQPGAFESNVRLLQVVTDIATELNVTRAQVALAWVLEQSPWICPIPGTRKPDHLRENFNSQTLTLSPEQLELLSRTFDPSQVTGARYPDALLQIVNT